MFTIICSLFSSIRQGFRTRAALHAEILALRHQLLVLQRSSRGHRLRLARPDRLLWVWLAHFWSAWRSALIIVKPETVIAWHQKGFRLYWRWKSRHRVGRPIVSTEVIALIRKMSLANPRWAAPRIYVAASHKPSCEAGRRAECGKSACSVRRGGEWKPTNGSVSEALPEETGSTR